MITPTPSEQMIDIDGRQYRKFIRFPEEVDDGTLRCIRCGQIDEEEFHDDDLCVTAATPAPSDRVNAPDTACPAPAEGDVTYYTKGKDGPWFEALSDKDFANEVSSAAMHLNDSGLGDDLDKWMPFQVMLADAANRIERLRPATDVRGGQPHPLAKFGSPTVAPLGLFRVHWKSGGSSLAAIGMMENGDRWIAPTNWIRPGTMPSAGEWADIERLEPIDAEPEDWRNDPAQDKRWNAGVDFVMTQLCGFLSVDPRTVMWDAATETLDGDVQSVLGNILRKHFGEDWGPAAPASESSTDA